MSTRTITREENFDINVEQLFALLHTPSAIREWWSVHHAIVLPEKGGVWAASWGESEDDPDYTSFATVSEFDPPHRMVLSDYRYRVKAGNLPFEADFVTEFVVTPNDNGATLRVTQSGFPAGAEADEFYAGCEAGWRDTFCGIRRFVDES